MAAFGVVVYVSPALFCVVSGGLMREGLLYIVLTNAQRADVNPWCLWLQVCREAEPMVASSTCWIETQIEMALVQLRAP